jgi:hypothetical protein
LKDCSLSFLSTPDGNVFTIQRIGGAKAVLNGFLLLGTGVDEVLEYVDTPTEVALAWRNAIVQVLQHYRPGRTLPSLDWRMIAAEAHPSWAEERYGVPAVPAPTPARRPRLAASSGGSAD